MIINTFRYQLNKISIISLKTGHPWIFKSNLSSAIKAIPEGSLLRLFDGNNRELGFGIYEPLGHVGVRIVPDLSQNPTIEDFKSKIETVLAKKEIKNAFRVLNGEGDGFPGLTLDIFNKTLVWQPYLNFWDNIIGELDSFLESKFDHQVSIIKPAKTEKIAKFIKGEEMFKEPVIFEENGLKFLSYPFSGQKTGFFLDLYNIRKILPKYVKDKKILNLFAGSGAFSLISAKHGAKEITNVESSKDFETKILDLFKINNLPSTKNKVLNLDIFKDLNKIEDKFDLIIIDPPQLTSRKENLNKAVNAMKTLLIQSSKKLVDNGMIIIINCTSFINRKLMNDIIQDNLPEFKILKKGGLPPDHTIYNAFPEGNYLSYFVLIK